MSFHVRLQHVRRDIERPKVCLRQKTLVCVGFKSYLTEGHKDILRQVLKSANRMGFTFHGYDLNDTSQINYFVTAGLNDIVFTIFYRQI